jgi:hypothetical protein
VELLDQRTPVENTNAITALGNDLDIMGYQKHGEPTASLPEFQQLDYLPLDGFIESCSRLVCYYQSWMDGEYASQVHASSLAAAEISGQRFCF